MVLQTAPVDAGVVVRLDTYEFLYAAQVGLARRIRNLAKATPAKHGFTNTAIGWSQDIDSACAEYAVAKHTGRFWAGAVGRDVDVGEHYQVRQTRYPDGHLVVYDVDYDDDVFILAVGGDGVFRLAGWISGWQAKHQAWLDAKREGGEAFFVPQTALHPMSELR